MQRKLIDILKLIGGDTQQQVENATVRWRNDIREQIKSLTGFKLSYRENGKVVQVTVPLSVEPGLPAPLESLMNEELPDDERWAVELIGAWKERIESLSVSANQLEPLVNSLSELPSWSERALKYRQTLTDVQDMTDQMRAYAVLAKLLKRMMAIEDDILGAYFYHEESSLFGYSARKMKIEIYWLVIGSVARIIGASVEGLTAVVLAHEIAHSYTHVARDLDWKCWESSFANSDREVKEGLAQFYTHLTMTKMREQGEVDLWDAYERLLNHQQGPYLCHLEWVGHCSPEVMREALVKTRRSKRNSTISEFKETLSSTSTALG